MNLEIWVDSPQYPDLPQQLLNLTTSGFSVLGGRRLGSYPFFEKEEPMSLVVAVSKNPFVLFSEHIRKNAPLRVGVVFQGGALLFEAAKFADTSFPVGLSPDHQVEYRIHFEILSSSIRFKWVGNKLVPL